MQILFQGGFLFQGTERKKKLNLDRLSFSPRTDANELRHKQKMVYCAPSPAKHTYTHTHMHTDILSPLPPAAEYGICKQQGCHTYSKT